MTVLGSGLENTWVFIRITMARMVGTVGRISMIGASKLLEEMVNSMRRGINEKEKKKRRGG